MTTKTFYVLWHKEKSKGPAMGDDDNWLFDTEAAAIDAAQGLFDVRPVQRWVRPDYLPGFVPSAADRHYGAAIAKLLRENEELRADNKTLTLKLDLSDKTILAQAEEMIAHGAAIRMIRDAIEELFGPFANLESEEAVLLRGPEPHHDAEAIIQALKNVGEAISEYYV